MLKLNPGLPMQSSIQKTEDCFQQQFRQKFKEETGEMLHLKHSFI